VPRLRLNCGAGGGVRYGGVLLLAEEGSDAVDDFVKRGLGAETGEGVEFVDTGDAAHHVLEARFVGLVVGDEFDGGRAAGAPFDQLGEAFDGDFFGVADVDDFADGAVGVHEADKAFDGVADIAEAAGLLAVAVDLDGLVVDGLLDEIGEDHAVTTGLAWANGIEKAHDDDGELFFFPVGECEKFIESFGGSVAPTAFGSGAKDEVGVFVERDVGVFAVDFGSRGSENELALFAGGFEDALGAVNIGFDGADGAFDDELDADGSGEVDDDVGIIDEFGEKLEIFDVVEVIFHLAGSFEVADVIHATGREIVEQDYAVAAGKKTLRQMGTDETGAAGDQITQRASLQSQVIVVMPRGAFADRLRKFRFIAIVSGISGFLRAVTIGIGIVPIRIVIVWSAGIHRIQDDAENVALDADKQIARAGEGFLGSFAAANDQEYAIRLNRKDNRVGGGHDGRRIDDDEFEFGAQFGDGLGQFVRRE